MYTPIHKNKSEIPSFLLEKANGTRKYSMDCSCPGFPYCFARVYPLKKLDRIYIPLSLSSFSFLSLFPLSLSSHSFLSLFPLSLSSFSLLFLLPLFIPLSPSSFSFLVFFPHSLFVAKHLRYEFLSRNI